MREIKFRAWDKKHNEMIYNYLSIHHLGNGLQVQNREGMVLDCHLMQFTGLKDKNGKDIYEGDIFKNYQADINTVIWFCDGWHYENYHAGALPLGQDAETCEVVGNIYENPELVTK